ncbi:MAG: hypothetical protein M1821_006431 [Bathelium mastoideum]|nr:MAG: hypothetical protein M1821_006431 [Bathelium mastoideum]
MLTLLGNNAAAKTCKSLDVPVNIEARQGTFNIPQLQSNLDATKFAQDSTSNQGNLTEEALTGYQTITGTYNISATFCAPDSNASNTTVQVLSHGIGSDKSYWDIQFGDGNYSYVDFAVDKYGYSTVAIDRLGIANSSHGDPLNFVQAPVEISALYEITKMLRNGSFPTVPTAFKNIVTVGHSFGSIQSFSLSALHPEAQDGIILTGFSGDAAFLGPTVAAWNLHIARLNQPFRFGSARNLATPPRFDRAVNLYTMTYQGLKGAGLSDAEVQQELRSTELGNILTLSNASSAPEPQDLPSGYLTWADICSYQYTFLYPGFYDFELALQLETTKQPLTVGEMLTIGSHPASTSFSGPVQIMTGERDAIFCGGDCFAVDAQSGAASIPAQAALAFPNAKAFETYIQPNTGHALNAHYNASAAYDAIHKFLEAHGLGSS